MSGFRMFDIRMPGSRQNRPSENRISPVLGSPLYPYNHRTNNHSSNINHFYQNNHTTMKIKICNLNFHNNHNNKNHIYFNVKQAGFQTSPYINLETGLNQSCFMPFACPQGPLIFSSLLKTLTLLFKAFKQNLTTRQGL